MCHQCDSKAWWISAYIAKSLTPGENGKKNYHPTVLVFSDCSDFFSLFLRTLLMFTLTYCKEKLYFLALLFDSSKSTYLAIQQILPITPLWIHLAGLPVKSRIKLTRQKYSKYWITKFYNNIFLFDHSFYLFFLLTINWC